MNEFCTKMATYATLKNLGQFICKKDNQNTFLSKTFMHTIKSFRVGENVFQSLLSCIYLIIDTVKTVILYLKVSLLLCFKM